MNILPELSVEDSLQVYYSLWLSTVSNGLAVEPDTKRQSVTKEWVEKQFYTIFLAKI